MSKYVYLVRAGESQYKVGVTSNIHKRICALQTSNPYAIKVVAAKKVDDASQVERSIHKQLKSMRMDGGKEWFNLTAAAAVDIAITISSYPDVTINDIESLYDLLFEHDQRQRNIYHKVERIMDSIGLKDKKRMRETFGPKIVPPRTPTKIIAIPSADRDEEIYNKAITVIIAHQKASSSFLQSELRIGYGRAARIIGMMEKRGIIGPADGSRPRQVFISKISDKARPILKI